MYFPILRANLAILGILRSAHVERDGRMDMAELKARWEQVPLRRQDLQRGVRRLESLGFIEIDRARGHQYVFLTAMGYRSSHSLIGWLESMLVWRRRLQWLFDQAAETPKDMARRARDRRQERSR